MKNYRYFSRINRFAVGIVTTLLLAGNAAAVNTHIQTDGTLSGIAEINVNAPGSNHPYTLSEINGKLSGHNLFYSFSNFSIGTTDTALFNLNTSDLANVISRVTGGSESLIDGKLQMTNVGSTPSFYFINPAGITFGPGASVDVPGSFYVSTASNLKFSDGSQYAANETSTSSLSSATPESFGFLGNEVGNLNLSGTETAKTNLNFKPGTDATFVASQIRIDNAIIDNSNNSAQTGLDLQLITTGEEAANIKLNVLPDHATSGDLTLHNANLIVSGNGLGRLIVRSGFFSVKDSTLLVTNIGDVSMATDQGVDINVNSLISDNSLLGLQTTANGDAGNLKVTVDSMKLINQSYISSINSKDFNGKSGDVLIKGRQVEIDNSYILNGTNNSKDGGNLIITADSLKITNKGLIANGALNSTGNGGDVTIKAREFEVDNSMIGSNTRSSGNGGVVSVTANVLRLDNSGQILSNTIGDGDSGIIKINAGLLESNNLSTISANTFGKGDAGGVTLRADSIKLNNGGSVTSDTSPTSEGHGGSIEVRTKNLEMNNALISSRTFGHGNAGNIDVAAEFIKLNNDSGFDRGIFSSSGESAIGNSGSIIINANNIDINGAFIGSDTGGIGNAGSVTITSDSLKLINRGSISSSVQETAEGNGGNVTLNIDHLVIENASVVSDTIGNGNAGNITVITGNLVVGNESRLSSDSFSDGNAGDVEITANSLVINGKGSISSDASINTESKGTKGNAGNVTIAADQLELDSGTVSSTTLGQGDAGVVMITAGILKLSNNGKISSSAAFLSGFNFSPSTGDGGDVIINARNVDISNGLILSTTQGEGNAGSIVITTDTLDSTGNSEIASSSGSVKHKIDAKGDAGSISIEARRLDIRDTDIASESTGSGNAGQVTVNAGSLVLRENGFISTSTLGPGHTGDISVTVDSLTAYGTGSTNIDLSSIKLTGIFSGAGPESSGQTGNIDLRVGNNIQLNNGALISIASFASAVDPNVKAGQIQVSSKDGSLYSLYLDSSVISTETAGGSGGALTISNSDNIFLRNSQITSSVKGESGNGGDINLASNFLVLDTGFIQANTEATAASGGDINIKVPTIIPSGNSLFVGGNTPFEFQPSSGLNVIQAVAPDGVNGTINAITPQLNLSAMLTNLMIEFFDSNSLNRDMCEVSESSSLMQSGKGAQPLRAKDLLLFPMF